jgi:hypothetical protein
VSDDSTVSLAVIALIGTIFTALFKLLNDNTRALNKMTASSEKIAAETAKGNREAKQRNGHLGEQNIQITKLIADQSKDLTAIRASGEANAATNQKSVELLEKTAVTLEKNTDLVARATKEVAKNLKDSDSLQLIDKQIVGHQTVKSKE